MTRNPKLQPLKDRLNPNQQIRRRARMRQRGSFRQEATQMMARQLGQATLLHNRQVALRRRINIQTLIILGLLTWLAGNQYGWWDVLAQWW